MTPLFSSSFLFLSLLLLHYVHTSGKRSSFIAYSDDECSDSNFLFATSRVYENVECQTLTEDNEFQYISYDCPDSNGVGPVTVRMYESDCQTLTGSESVLTEGCVAATDSKLKEFFSQTANIKVEYGCETVSTIESLGDQVGVMQMSAWNDNFCTVKSLSHEHTFGWEWSGDSDITWEYNVNYDSLERYIKSGICMPFILSPEHTAKVTCHSTGVVMIDLFDSVYHSDESCFGLASQNAQNYAGRLVFPHGDICFDLEKDSADYFISSGYGNRRRSGPSSSSERRLIYDPSSSTRRDPESETIFYFKFTCTLCDHKTGYWDVNTDCTTCEFNYDEASDCQQCKDGWDINTNCRSCIDGRGGADCLSDSSYSVVVTYLPGVENCGDDHVNYLRVKNYQVGKCTLVRKTDSASPERIVMKYAKDSSNNVVAQYYSIGVDGAHIPFVESDPIKFSFCMYDDVPVESLSSSAVIQRVIPSLSCGLRNGSYRSPTQYGKSEIMTMDKLSIIVDNPGWVKIELFVDDECSLPIREEDSSDMYSWWELSSTLYFPSGECTSTELGYTKVWCKSDGSVEMTHYEDENCLDIEYKIQFMNEKDVYIEQSFGYRSGECKQIRSSMMFGRMTCKNDICPTGANRDPTDCSKCAGNYAGASCNVCRSNFDLDHACKICKHGYFGPNCEHVAEDNDRFGVSISYGYQPGCTSSIDYGIVKTYPENECTKVGSNQYLYDVPTRNLMYTCNEVAGGEVNSISVLEYLDDQCLYEDEVKNQGRKHNVLPTTDCVFDFGMEKGVYGKYGCEQWDNIEPLIDRIGIVRFDFFYDRFCENPYYHEEELDELDHWDFLWVDWHAFTMFVNSGKCIRWLFKNYIVKCQTHQIVFTEYADNECTQKTTQTILPNDVCLTIDHVPIIVNDYVPYGIAGEFVSCEPCPQPNYDASTGCVECEGNYDKTTNCQLCKPGFDINQDCRVCLPGGFQGPDCEQAKIERFGESYGDVVHTAADDTPSSSAFHLGSNGINFMGENENTWYFNINGYGSFAVPYSTYTPKPLDTFAGKMISAYWTDIDLRGSVEGGLGNKLYYRALIGDTVASADADYFKSQIPDDQWQSVIGTTGNNFSPDIVLVATWDRVGYYNTKVDKLATFQMVILAESEVGGKTVAIFNYEQLDFFYYTAAVGFTAGTAGKTYSLPCSGAVTDELLNTPLLEDSNVGVSGRWAFRVDQPLFTCFGESSFDPNVCSSHGACTSNDFCTCTDFWYDSTGCDQCDSVYDQETCSECNNPKYSTAKSPVCEQCINDKHNPDDGCGSCDGDVMQQMNYPACDECIERDLHDKATYCTTCLGDPGGDLMNYPDCNACNDDERWDFDRGCSKCKDDASDRIEWPSCTDCKNDILSMESNCVDCKNDPFKKFDTTTCTECKIPAQDFNEGCFRCKDDPFQAKDYPTCTSCVNNLHDIQEDCAMCKDDPVGRKNYPLCTRCNDYWDFATDCTICSSGGFVATCDRCVDGYDPADNCASCLPGRDFAQSCTTCLPNYDPADDCTSCLGYYYPVGDCSLCMPNFQPGCMVCKGNFDILSYCQTCVDFWTGENCTECDAKYNIPQCDACASPLFDMNDDCDSCIGNLNYTDGCNSCSDYWINPSNDCMDCPENFNADCSGCINHYAIGSNCQQCETNWNPASNCTECLDYWNGPDCLDCPNELFDQANCDSCLKIHYDPNELCTKCLGNWDIATDCIQCKGHFFGAECSICPNLYEQQNCETCKDVLFDPEKDCIECKLRNQDPASGCTECKDFWTGEECKTCELRFNDECTGCRVRNADIDSNCEHCSDFWTGTNCDVCPFDSIENLCKKCKNGMSEESNCACEGNFKPPECIECVNHYDQATNCQQCEPNFDIDTSCQRCLGAYMLEDGCKTCPERYDQDVSSKCTLCMDSRFDEESDCLKCKGNFDIRYQCQRCIGHFELQNDCQTCPDNFEDDCLDCLPGFSLTSNCTMCEDSWQGENCDSCPLEFGDSDCKACINHYDMSSNCSTCEGNWDLSTECTTCKDYWEGVSCQECPAGFEATCSDCIIDTFDPEKGCLECRGFYMGEACDFCPFVSNSSGCEICKNGREPASNCSCFENFEPPNCLSCINRYELSSGCTQCETNFDPASQCTKCLDYWTGGNCTDCGAGYDSECKTCLWPNFDPEKGCTECKGNSINPGNNCQDCRDYWKGDDCSFCWPLVFNANCTNCSVNGYDPEKNCMLCKGNRNIWRMCQTCENYWTGEDCLECPQGYDEDSGCSECKEANRDPERLCELCLGNWDETRECKECKNNFYGENCKECSDKFDKPSCSRCVKANYDENRDCDMCKGNFDLDSDCTECVHFWSGPGCDVCGSAFNSECTECANPRMDSSKECKSCKGFFTGASCDVCPFESIEGMCEECANGMEPMSNCHCPKNYADTPECEKCINSYDITTGCTDCFNSDFEPDSRCSACKGYRIYPSTNCTMCPSGYRSSDCGACEKPNYDPENNCKTCEGKFKLADDCLTCEGYWELSSDCTTCPVGYEQSKCFSCEIENMDPDLGCSDCLYPNQDVSNDCATCTDYWSGDTCSDCGALYEQTSCATCIKPNFDPDRGCIECLPEWKNDASNSEPNCDECTFESVADLCVDCLNGNDPESLCRCPRNYGGSTCSDCINNFEIGSGCTDCKGNFDVNTRCVKCKDYWEGENCDLCPPQYEQTQCKTCVQPNRVAEFDCKVCTGNFDHLTGCTRCKGHFKMPSCVDCPPNYNDQCTGCRGNWDIKTNCTKCLYNFDEQTNCTTCKNKYEGKYCLKCPEGYDENSDCISCRMYLDEKKQCKGCVGNREYGPIELDASLRCRQCVGNWDIAHACTECLPNYDLIHNCAVCVEGYDLNSNCEQCSHHGDLSTNCKTCTKGTFWDPTTGCRECPPNFNKECTTCVGRWTLESRCTQCSDLWQGEFCDVCTNISNPMSGTCRRGQCADHWTGVYCDHCLINNPRNGTCKIGVCEPFWQGSDCDECQSILFNETCDGCKNPNADPLRNCSMKGGKKKSVSLETILVSVLVPLGFVICAVIFFIILLLITLQRAGIKMKQLKIKAKKVKKKKKKKGAAVELKDAPLRAEPVQISIEDKETGATDTIDFQGLTAASLVSAVADKYVQRHVVSVEQYVLGIHEGKMGSRLMEFTDAMVQKLKGGEKVIVTFKSESKKVVDKVVEPILVPGSEKKREGKKAPSPPVPGSEKKRVAKKAPPPPPKTKPKDL